MILYQKFSIFKYYIFFNSEVKLGHPLCFSSDLEKIGIEWDVAIKNGSYVEIVSDPIEITRSQYGTFDVVKIKADVAEDFHTIIKEFWVPAVFIYKVENNETKSSQLLH